MKSRIVTGPATIGNVFGIYGCDIPAGRYAVCVGGEYANGGHGPSTVDGKLYSVVGRTPTGRLVTRELGKPALAEWQLDDIPDGVPIVEFTRE